jgi:hypothetical protein
MQPFTETWVRVPRFSAIGARSSVRRAYRMEETVNECAARILPGCGRDASSGNGPFTIPYECGRGVAAK